MKKRIHVNQHNIRSNKTKGTDLPVITIKTYKDNTYANRIKICGDSEVIYCPDRPLSCGARVWIETDAEVEIIS